MAKKKTLAQWKEEHSTGLSEAAIRDLDEIEETAIPSWRGRFRSRALLILALVGGGGVGYTGKQVLDAGFITAERMVGDRIQEVNAAMSSTISDFLIFFQAYLKNLGTFDGALSIFGDIWDGVGGFFSDVNSSFNHKDITIEQSLAAMDAIALDKPNPIPKLWALVKADIQLLQAMKGQAEVELADPAAFASVEAQEFAQNAWGEFKRQMAQRTQEAKAELEPEEPTE